MTLRIDSTDGTMSFPIKAEDIEPGMETDMATAYCKQAPWVSIRYVRTIGTTRWLPLVVRICEGALVFRPDDIDGINRALEILE